MKKILAWMLAMMLVLCSVSALAEKDELAELREQIAALQAQVDALMGNQADAQTANRIGGTLMTATDSYDFLKDDYNWVPGNRNLLRYNVIYIYVVSSLDGAPDSAWDMSANRDRSVLGWAEELGDGYALYIGSNGRVRANVDSEAWFAGYRRLEGLYLNGNLDTSETENFYKFFQDCEALQTVDLSTMDTSSATDLSGLFSWCKNLQEVDLSSFDTSNNKWYSTMFYRCENLRWVNLSSFDTSNAYSMSSMFEGCGNLSSLDISNFDTRSVKHMDEMFKDTSSLMDLRIGENFVIGDETDSTDMFEGCALYNAFMRDQNGY